MVIGGGMLASCVTTAVPETQPMGMEVLDEAAIRAARNGAVRFVDHVKPVLESKCVTCHNRNTLPGHVSLESREEAVRSGALGVYIVPGKPKHSLLVQHVESTHRSASAMPAVGMRLTTHEQQILKKWVLEGAAWPAGREGVLHYVP